MKSILKEHGRELIGSLILIAITSLITWMLPGGWSTVWSGVTSFFTWLGEDVSQPRWVAIILWLALITLLGTALIVGWHRFRDTDEAVERAEKVFYDILWRWEWVENRIKGPYAFCPGCDLQVRPIETHSYALGPTVRYECDNPECRALLKEFDGKEHSDIENLVRRKIQQELRKTTRNTKTGNA